MAVCEEGELDEDAIDAAEKAVSGAISGLDPALDQDFVAQELLIQGYRRVIEKHGLENAVLIMQEVFPGLLNMGPAIEEDLVPAGARLH
jgi:hypothetical protein